MGMNDGSDINGVHDFYTVLFGYATTVIPRIYTYYVSTALFAIFGVRMLREGLKMSPDEGQEELEEVQAEIKKKDEEVPLNAPRFCSPHHTRLAVTWPLWFRSAPPAAPAIETDEWHVGRGSRLQCGLTPAEVAQLHFPHLHPGFHPHLPRRVGWPLPADHHCLGSPRGLSVLTDWLALIASGTSHDTRVEGF